jgi:hypothetical protein
VHELLLPRAPTQVMLTVIAIDAALHCQRTTRTELSSVLASCRGWPAFGE